MAEKMARVRLEMPQSVLDSINARLRAINGRGPGEELSANQVGKEALALYKWAVEQAEQGYAVVAANARGEPVTQIATPHLPARAPTSR